MTSRHRCGIGAATLAALWLSATPASAQMLPSGPIVLADGQIAVSGDLSVSFAPRDPGFFNYDDYEHSQMRLFRGDVTVSAKAGDHVTFLGDLRSENGSGIRPYGLYLRLHPWTARAIDVQVGRIPPTFGAFARRTYGTDNPVIGDPIAYQYLTSLREDSLPANADELLRKRGQGSLLSFSIGNQEVEHGVAIASASRWDTGVQVHAASRAIDATASVTTGTLSYPILNDDNSGKRVAGRLVARPIVGLVLGASASRGPFLHQSVVRAAVGEGRDGEFTQTAWGGDVEYSRDYYVLRVETMFSGWTIPLGGAGAGGDTTLRARSTSFEGKYKIHPGLYAAARIDHIGFNDITGTLGRESWDAPVTRVEIGTGYSLQRNLLLKLSYQHDHRDAGDVRTLSLMAAQLQFWF